MTQHWLHFVRYLRRRHSPDAGHPQQHVHAGPALTCTAPAISTRSTRYPLFSRAAASIFCPSLIVRYGSEDGRTIKSGQVPNLATGADETNELVLVADGETGYFFVNGTAAGAFPLSARTEPGNISIAIELRGGQGFASGATRYEGFQVRDLP